MLRTLTVLLLVVLTGCGTSHLVRRLSPAEHDHYYALKVWMSPEEQKEYLKLKTEQERDDWLKSHGKPKPYWDRFYQYDDATRQAIVAGDVKVGWTADEMYMAWGEPHSRAKLTGRPAQRSELDIYRFEVQPDGSVLVWAPGSKTEYKAVEEYQLEVYVDDDKITDMVKKDHWE